MAESASILMQRTPKQLDNKLTDCYQKVMALEGVQGVQVSQNKNYFSYHHIELFSVQLSFFVASCSTIQSNIVFSYMYCTFQSI